MTGADPREAAGLAAHEVARACHAAIAARGHALIALSGGETPWLMIQSLRGLPLDWARIHVAQVDERMAPAGDPRRNLVRLRALLVDEGPLPAGNLHAMPVENDDPDDAAHSYAAALESRFGAPLCFDLVQLGLGTDGHTASLVPGDPVLEVRDRDVALTAAPYQGLRRMTLTYPALNRARQRLWLVTGASKAARLRELMDHSGDGPATGISTSAATLVADAAAVEQAPAAP